MVDIKSMYKPEVISFMEEMGEKKFRATQLFEWMHKKRAASFDDMTNLSLSLRETLKEKATLDTLEKVQVLESKTDGTRKYLFKASDGALIESVMMRYSYGVSLCVSSQVGCAMGCSFCASTVNGLDRNLTAGEILEQVYGVERDSGERVSHVVVMGMGEPFANYENLIRFLRLITDPEAGGLGARNITVSTCGIVPGILRFAEEKIPVTLALSLHASDQAERERIMPVARKYPLPEVLSACDEYFNKTGRRVTYEYALIDGVNDTDEDARRMGELLGGKNCHVNLIPVNPVDGKEYRPGNASRFKNKLENYRINATIRRALGGDIDGACGQLRNRNSGRD
ncbi:MAG: 23S rRNA (adenine(2503)-C(2))-methyltransferase RlmN [Eubacterium sp.]|nr:23S rRNA (adenine(2503)-C(2))-methyltransferase RlmN [Eubacterium sp.]